ncbi:hypothetical protein MOV01_004366 [Vibrio vulnificus]|nr:hypothetical protein [Vibrio vulnificus]
MATIGQRVKLAIDHASRGEMDIAIEHACNAIDVTSQRYYSQKKSSNSCFKQLLSEYSWLIEIMSLRGINLDETTFDNFPIKIFNKIEGKPRFCDLIYHVVRCGLVHSDTLEKGFSFHDRDAIEIADKELVLPSSILWGLLGVVVFCPANVNEETDDRYYISIFGNRFVINDFWGQEAVARHVASRHKGPRVTLTNLNFE